MLSLYRRLMHLRRGTPALTIGSFRTLQVDDEVFVYERQHNQERVVVALNLSHDVREVRLPANRVLLSTYLDDVAAQDTLRLRANEGVILG